MKTYCTKYLKQVKFSESKKASLENGTNKEKSKQLEHLEVCACSTSQVSTQTQTSQQSERKQIQSVYCIPESQVQNKKTILKDKNNTSDLSPMILTNIPHSQRSLISGRVLTLKDPDCYEFWDSSKKERYQQLLWLQETDLQDLDLNSLNGSVQSSELKSWFSTIKIQPQNQNLEMTSWQLSKFTVVDGMEKEDTKIKTVTKARKLKLNPTKEQKLKLNQWAGCVRFLYNKSIGILTNKNNKSIRTKNQLRSRLSAVKNQKSDKKNSFFNNKKWLEECPSSIRKGAIYDAKANLQSCFSNKKNGYIKMFKSPYRTKKKEQQQGYSFSIEKNNISKDCNKLYIFKTILKEMKYFGTKQLHKLIPDNKPQMDCKIQKTAYGEYFLIIPYTVTIKHNNKKTFDNPVSIDPGVRKLLTTYAPNSRESFFIGNRWSSKIMKFLLILDKSDFKSKNEKILANNNFKKKFVKTCKKRLRKKVANLKTEMRNQCANFISKRYDVVMMPKLETGKLSIKSSRRLKTNTVRAMLNAGHSKLFESIRSKCLENGSKFLHVREEFTSKTCPSCGHLNSCDEIYNCQKCAFKHDRDITGALNIMLKAIR